MVIVMCSDNW